MTPQRHDAHEAKPRGARASGRAHARRVLLFVGCTLMLLGTVAGTRAWLSDSAATSTISLQGVTVGTPTGLTLVENVGGGIDASWTAPASGETPTQYEVFRRVSGASWGTVPIATLTYPTAAWTDTAVVSCTSYIYRVRAVHQGIPGDPSAQDAVTPGDTQRPTIVRSRIAGTSGLVDIADFIKPSGEFYAFVEVSDACSAPEAIGVDLTLTDLGVPTTEPARFGTWMAGGIGYNFRAGPFTSGALLVDGALPAWVVSASDDGGARVGAGAAPRVDAVGPVAASAPEIVSGTTNYFATSLGSGEVQPGGTFRAYGRFTDARSGVPAAAAAVTVDATNLGGAASIDLADGTFSTDNGIATWTRRSGLGTAGVLPDGTVTVSVIARDAVGNSTSTNVGVEVDGTALGVGSCTAATGGGPANTLRLNDTSTLTFTDTVDPGSVAPSWTAAAPFTFNAILTNGTNDRFDFSGLTLLAGAGAGQAFDLGATNWVAADLAFTGSTIELPARDQLLITYKGGTNTTLRATSGTMQLSPAVTDAAGNGVSPASTTCSTQW